MANSFYLNVAVNGTYSYPGGHFNVISNDTTVPLMDIY